MIKPLFIDQCFQFEHSPAGEVSRSFLGAMDPKDWDPVVYASDRAPLVKNKPDFVKLSRQNGYYRYAFGAIRKVLPDLTWLPGVEWPAWGRNATKQILKDIKNDVIKPDYIHSVCYHVANHWSA